MLIAAPARHLVSKQWAKYTASDDISRPKLTYLFADHWGMSEHDTHSHPRFFGSRKSLSKASCKSVKDDP